MMKFIHKFDWRLGKTINNQSRLDEQEQVNEFSTKEKSMGALFKDFYNFTNGVNPKGELIDLFLDIMNEEGENIDEAN